MIINIHLSEGGVGSGNKGHAGILGHRGGSMPTGRQLEGLREPWEMTQAEFINHQLPVAGEGNIILYHRLRNPQDLESVLSTGLLSSHKSAMAEGPRGAMWFTDTPKGYSEEGVLIGIEVPKATTQTAGVGQYIMNDVSPDKIVYVDRPTYSPVSSLSRLSDERTSKYAKVYHLHYVKDALEKGKPVPPEVLKDYPELVK